MGAGRGQRQGHPSDVGAAVSLCPSRRRGACDGAYDVVRTNCGGAGANGGGGDIEAAMYLLCAVKGGEGVLVLVWWVQDRWRTRTERKEKRWHER